MVRFTSILHLSLLAAVALATPRLQGRQDVKCAKDDACRNVFCIDGSSSTCLESKTCGCSTLVVRCAEGEKISCQGMTAKEQEEKGTCTCQKPVDTQSRKKYNQKQRKFLDEDKKEGINWTATEFPKQYPEQYERWHWQNSSRTHQTPSEALNKTVQATLARNNLMWSAPEIYPRTNSFLFHPFNPGSSKGKVTNGTNGGLLSNSTSGGHWNNSTSGNGTVQVPGTDKWVKANVTTQRLEELASIVPKVEEANSVLSELLDEEKKVKEELKSWLKPWLKQERTELKESEEKIKKAEKEAEEKAEDEKMKKIVCGDKDDTVQFTTTDPARKHMDKGGYIWEADDFISRLSKKEMESGGKYPFPSCA